MHKILINNREIENNEGQYDLKYHYERALNLDDTLTKS